MNSKREVDVMYLAVRPKSPLTIEAMSELHLRYEAGWRVVAMNFNVLMTSRPSIPNGVAHEVFLEREVEPPLSEAVFTTGNLVALSREEKSAVTGVSPHVAWWTPERRKELSRKRKAEYAAKKQALAEQRSEAS